MKAQATSKRNSDKVVLGYFSGSKTHNGDFKIIESVLCKLLGQYKNLHIKIVGVLETGNDLDKYEERIERVEFMPWQQLPNEFAAIDINLMPLENSFFHWCKSENKWLEAALVGTPTVFSSNPELDAVISNGVNGLSCKTVFDWEMNLMKLIDSPILRQQIGNAALRYVLEHYITTTAGQEVREFAFGKE
jgi:glycosyltransferase involved in cell wall biosynthesis